MNRSVRQPNETIQEPAGLGGPKPPIKKSKFKKSDSKWLNFLFVFLVFSATILIVAILTSLVFSTNKNESKYIDRSKLQAIFLNNGQVYFGNIDTLNQSYAKLNNVYYLRVNQQVQPGEQAKQNDVSLAKLGCELHGPQDQMIINRSEVTFWENLKDDGQVAKAVAEFVKANPNGQDCQQTGATGSTGTGTNAEASTGSNATPSTTPQTNSSNTSRSNP